MPDTDQDINPVDAKKPADKTLTGNFSSSPGSAKCRKYLSVPTAVFTTDLEPRNDSCNPQAVHGQGEATGENKMAHESETKNGEVNSQTDPQQELPPQASSETKNESRLKSSEDSKKMK